MKIVRKTLLGFLAYILVLKKERLDETSKEFIALDEFDREFALRVYKKTGEILQSHEDIENFYDKMHQLYNKEMIQILCPPQSI